MDATINTNDDAVSATVATSPPGATATTKTTAKRNKKKKKVITEPVHDNPLAPPHSSSSSSSSSAYCFMEASTSSSYTNSSTLKRRDRVGFRVSGFGGRKNPRIMFRGSTRQNGLASPYSSPHVDALALPLGMSIAAVLSQVLDSQDAVREHMSADMLSKICSLAVRESLANVFGDDFDCFVKNFEKSFRSTLVTLRLLNKSCPSNGELQSHKRTEVSCSDTYRVENSTYNSGEERSVLFSHDTSTSITATSTEEVEDIRQMDQTNWQLGLPDRQLRQQITCLSPGSSSFDPARNQLMVSSLIEKSVTEQARLNDLKALEISLTMKKLQLKESQLALSSDANLLERCKLSMGVSKASFKAEKFKTQLEDTRHVELRKTCIDCLVAGLLIMLFCLLYGAYVFSPKRIIEAATVCTPAMESKSWWVPKPMSNLQAGLQTLWCYLQVGSRMLFGVLLIVAIAFLLIQRSSMTSQIMPITFILLLLGVACGVAGTFCINTLGGNGYHWLFYWEILCLLHLLSNVFTSTFFHALYGPVAISERTKSRMTIPYWTRRLLFYVTTLLFLPVICGLMAFASVGEWIEHFSLLIEFSPSYS